MRSRTFIIIILFFLLVQSAPVIAGDRNYAQIYITMTQPYIPPGPGPSPGPEPGGGFGGGGVLIGGPRCGNGIVDFGEQCEYDSNCSLSLQCFSCNCIRTIPPADINKIITRVIFDFNTVEEMPYKDLVKFYDQLDIPFIEGFARTLEGKKLFSLTKNIKIVETIDLESNFSHRTIFTLYYKNVSNFYSGVIEVAERKEPFVNSYSELYSDKGIYLLGSDFFGFRFEDIAPSEEVTIKYYVDKFVEPEELMKSVKPVTLTKSVGSFLCEVVSCEDYNPCTTDECSVGNCIYYVVDDGTSCGSGLTCFEGNCLKQESEFFVFPFLPPYFFAILTLGAVIIGIHLIYTFKHLFYFK